MIVFHNPGVIDLEAVRLMGVSVKEPGAFGRFGTGLKYAVATILRNGGKIHLVRRVNGQLVVGHFDTRDVEARGHSFQEVSYSDPLTGALPMNVTTALGKDWEPWMVVRELGCNARDEGGSFLSFQGEPLIQPNNSPAPRLVEAFETDPNIETAFIVDWPELEADWDSVVRSAFIEGEALHDDAGVRVLTGPSEYLYHRGVRVWKLPKPSHFTYDLTAPVELTEDRTVKYGFVVLGVVRNMLLRTAERSVIAAVVTARNRNWEGNFDWSGKDWAPIGPGPEWLEEVATLRSNNSPGLSKSAIDVLLAHSAFNHTAYYGGGAYDEPTGVFADVVGILGELGVDLSSVNIFIAKELPGDQKSTVRDGHIYAKRELIDEGSALEIATEMLNRYAELQSGGNHDRLLNFTTPLLLKQNYALQREMETADALKAQQPKAVEEPTLEDVVF